jgi:hypothetical protein
MIMTNHPRLTAFNNYEENNVWVFLVYASMSGTINDESLTYIHRTTS